MPTLFSTKVHWRKLSVFLRDDNKVENIHFAMKIYFKVAV